MSAGRAAVFVLLLFLALPLVVPALDLLPYPEVWGLWREGERLAGLARNTLLLLAGTLAIALPLGTVGAVLLYRTDLPGRALLRFLAVLTLFVPLPLFASGWEAALGSTGWLPLTFWSEPLPNDPDVSPTGLVWKAWGRGLHAAVWIHAMAALPWVVLLVGQGLRWVERDLEEDALTDAGPGRVLRAVTLRRARMAIGAAALWVALQTVTEISVTDMFQVRTFAEEIYTQYVLPDEPRALARAVALSFPSVLLTWLVVILALRSGERRLPPLRVMTGEPYVYRLGAARVLLAVLVFVAVGVLVAIPVGSLIWKMGMAGSPVRWSASAAAQHFTKALQTRGGLVAESLAVAALAGGMAATLALLSCWLAVGSRLLRAAVLALVAAAWAVPGPTVGFGLLGIITHVVDWAGAGALATLLYYGPSPVPVLWADLVRFFPFAVAVLWPVVRLVPHELRDAAQVEGATPGQELRHVVWPLTTAAWLRAALAVAVLALGELSAGKLVETPGSQTFAHEVFTQMHYGVTNDLAALGLVLLGAVLLGGSLLAGVDRLTRGRWRFHEAETSVFETGVSGRTDPQVPRVSRPG